MPPVFPHGPCECTSGMCPCSQRPGPAFASVMRQGKKMKVCTLCDRSSDRDTRILVIETEDLGIYLGHDPMARSAHLLWLIARQKAAQGTPVN